MEDEKRERERWRRVAMRVLYVRDDDVISMRKRSAVDWPRVRAPHRFRGAERSVFELLELPRVWGAEGLILAAGETPRAAVEALVAAIVGEASVEDAEARRALSILEDAQAEDDELEARARAAG